MPTQLTKPVTRKTSTPAAKYGPDARLLIAVTLIPGGAADDIIRLRPLRTKRSRDITVADLWSLLQKIEANKKWSEQMAERKRRKAEAKANRALRRPLPANAG